MNHDSLFFYIRNQADHEHHCFQPIFFEKRMDKTHYFHNRQSPVACSPCLFLKKMHSAHLWCCLYISLMWPTNPSSSFLAKIKLLILLISSCVCVLLEKINHLAKHFLLCLEKQGKKVAWQSLFRLLPLLQVCKNFADKTGVSSWVFAMGLLRSFLEQEIDQFLLYHFSCQT